jgi:hypothetical protein
VVFVGEILENRLGNGPLRLSLEGDVLVGASALVSVSIMNISDLASPGFAKLQFCVRLYTWKHESDEPGKRAIQAELSGDNEVENTSQAFSNGDFVNGIIERVLQDFDAGLPRDPDDSWRVEVRRYRDPIEQEMRDAAREFWTYEYLHVRVSRELRRCKEGFLTPLNDQMAALTLTQRGDFSFEQLAARAQTDFGRFVGGMPGMPAEIVNSNEYQQKVRAAQDEVIRGITQAAQAVVAEATADRARERREREAAEEAAAAARREAEALRARGPPAPLPPADAGWWNVF